MNNTLNVNLDVLSQLSFKSLQVYIPIHGHELNPDLWVARVCVTKFWPEFIFTRSWTHPGNLCCQVCFPQNQTSPCISPLISQCCLLQCLIFSPASFYPLFFWHFNSCFPGSMWYWKTKSILWVKYKDLIVFYISWPLGVPSWLKKKILWCVCRTCQPCYNVDLC